MIRKKSKLQLAQDEAQAAIDKTNQKISELGEHTSSLYAALNNIQELFDAIRNVPSDKKLEYEKFKEIRLNWKQQAEKIESDYKTAVAKNAGAGAAGVGAGVAVVALGPTAAMGIATTFGVASTGTAISALSGAAATNAALAWLGGGGACGRRRNGCWKRFSCTCWAYWLGYSGCRVISKRFNVLEILE